MKEREVGPGRAGPGRAGPVHVRNGLFVKNYEFLYFQKCSAIFIKDFSALLSSPIYDRRRSSLRSRLRRDAPYGASLRSSVDVMHIFLLLLQSNLVI